MFTKIESGFSNLDETVNFGNRIVGETRELCEISTLAVISCDPTEERFEDLKIQSLCESGTLYFSIGNVFQIMKDKEISEQLAVYTFHTSVQCFAISKCAKYILICTKDEIVIREYLVSDKNVFMQKLDFSSEFEDVAILNCFADSEKNSFYVVTTNGLIFNIIQTSQKEKNTEFHFEMEEICNLRSIITLCTLGDTCIYVQGLQMAYLIDLDDYAVTEMYSNILERVYSIGINFLSINKEGGLCLISTLTGQVFALEDAMDRYEQLTVLNDVVDSSKVNLVAVTKAAENQDSQIQLMSFPEFEKQYSLKAPSPISLMNVKGLNGEVLFFLKIFDDGVISEVRLQCVYEADPVLRVERLTKKRQFDEAMKFAELHNVDREIVLKAKAEDLISKMKCTTEDVDELLRILEQISEKLFRLNCCFLTDCQTGEDARRVLLYCIDMDIGIRDTFENRLKYPELEIKEQINQKLFKLDTYLSVYGFYECERWNEFFDNSLLDKMIFFLENEELEEAITICNRLDVVALKELTLLKVEEILNVFDRMSLKYVIFLKAFIPVILKNLSGALPRFISWLYERVYSLELNDDDFPEVAIKLVENVINIIDKSLTNSNIKFEQNAEKLVYLFGALKDLGQVQTDFGIRIPLREFIENPADTITFLLRAEMSKENLENTMSKFLCPFMLKIHMDRDPVLLSEIEYMLNYEENDWSEIVPVFYKFIIKDSNKLAAIEAILGAADVPWSQTIRNLAKNALLLPSKNGLTKKMENSLINEKKRIVMKKYHIPETGIKTEYDIEFYSKKILQINLDSAVEDIYNLCRDDDDKNRADSTMIKTFIEREDFTSAMKILDSNSPEIIVKQAETLLYKTFERLNNKLITKYDEFYYKASTLLWDRVNKHCNDETTKQKSRDMFEDIKSVYPFRHEFGTVCKWRDICDRKSNEKLLDEHIGHISLAVEQGGNLTEILRLCTILATYIKRTPDEVLVKFMSVHDNLQLILEMGLYMLENTQNSKTLSLASVLLFKYLKSSVEDEAEETFLDVTLSDSKNEDYLQSVKLARKLAIKAMLYATPDDHLAVMEVMHWVNSCYYFTNWDHKPFTSTLDSNIYLPKNTTYPFCNAFEAIKKVFNGYVAKIEKFKNPNTRYLIYFNTDNLRPQRTLDDLHEFFGAIVGLIKEDQHLSAYSMIKTLQTSYRYDTSEEGAAVVKSLQNLIVEKWLPQTLEMVLSAAQIDKFLLLSTLLLYGKDFVKPLQRALASYKRNPSKMSSMSQVGLKLTEMFNISAKQELSNYMHICKWWQNLNKSKQTLKISYENFFRSDHETRLEHLIAENQLDLTNITEYCKDFGIGNAESAYLKLLKITLLSWKPEYEILTNVRNKKSIHVKNTEEQLFEKCWEIVKAIENKGAVYDLTEKIWPLVNFYYYEVFLVLLEIQLLVQSSNTSDKYLYRILVTFLRGYTRVAGPARTEIEAWCGTFPTTPFIDPLSEYRLPLHEAYLSSKIWNIIKPEVNLTTYEQWFEVSFFCQDLNQDNICVYAIQSVLESEYFVTKNRVEWNFDYHQELIDAVENCAKNITDVQQAAAAVYNLTCGMPPGIDKVEMAKKSYKYAIMHKEKNPTDEVEKLVLKVKNRYFNVSAMHILYKYNLAEKNYLMQVSTPSELIYQLYKDPRIFKKSRNIENICPDINSAVDELTQFFKLDKNRIKYTALLENLNDDSYSNTNQIFSPNSVSKFDKKDNLKRACYICSDDKDYWRTILFNIGFGIQYPYPDLVTAEYKDFAFKADALKCFYILSDPNTVQQMSGVDPESFLILIEKMDLISKINNIGILIENVEFLDNLPKNKLLKDLVRLNFDQATSVRCMAKVCKLYAIDDMKYWEFILNTATKLNMVQDLMEYVEELKYRSVTQSFKAAWRLIVLHAFSQDDSLETNNVNNIFNKYVDCVSLVQRCPIAYALDIETCIEKCITRKRFEFAAVLLQYLRKDKVKFFNKQLSSTTIFKDVRNLRNHGIVGINQVLDILAQCH